MKKIMASAGLVAVSTTGLYAAAPDLTPMEASKPWSISATLRGFYDDNYTAQHKDAPGDADSFGFEVRPAASVNFPMEQTFVGLGYVYSLRYYADRDDDKADHSHEFTLKADHRFSERYKIAFDDSFVYSQEPAVIDADGAITAVQRVDADAMRNRAGIDFTADLTERFGLGLGYQNTWYDYDDEDGNFIEPSRSGLLDRMEHLFRVDGRWRARENLVGLIGYQYGIFDYTSDEEIALTTDGPITGDDRDNTSHYFYLGAEHALSSQFSASARVGAQFTDFDNLGTDSFGPYADIMGTYTYLPGSYLQFGFRHARNATDVIQPEGDEVVTDQESSTLFASINHRITPHLTGSVIGQYQRSTFNEGALDGDVDNFLLLGLNLEYRFNPNWSTEAGYNFDRLDSDVAFRSFTRNRVYVGVRATY
jgi:hypothetical protein